MYTLKYVYFTDPSPLDTSKPRPLATQEACALWR